VSGPTVDNKKSKIPSLTHDSLCQLIELGLVDKKYLPIFDGIFYRMCKERKIKWIKTRIWFRGLKIFSKFWVKRQHPKIYIAY
jgi:hypothetical protein